MDEFSVSAAEQDSMVHVDVGGDVDLATADRFHAEVVPWIQPGREVALDCAGVRFLDSTGLRVLLDLNHRAQESGGELVLVAPSEAVSRVLDLAGVAALFTVRRPDAQ